MVKLFSIFSKKTDVNGICEKVRCYFPGSLSLCEVLPEETRVSPARYRISIPRAVTLRPVLSLSMAFMSGILLAGYSRGIASPGKMLLLVLLLMGLVGLTFLLLKKPLFFFVFLILFFISLGYFRYMSSVAPCPLNVQGIIEETPQQALVYGYVADPPERVRGAFGGILIFDLELEQIRLGDGEGRRASGRTKVRVYGRVEDPPEYGDKIVVSGRIYKPPGPMNPGESNIRENQSKIGVYAWMNSSCENIYVLSQKRRKGSIVGLKRRAAQLRRRSSDILERMLSKEALVFARAVILGERSGIRGELSDILAFTGTRHMVAVSGLHVGIVASIILLTGSVLRLPRSFRSFLAISGMLFFALFTGGSPSSIRAAIMGSIVVLSLSFGKRPDIVNAIALSALIITFIDPSQIFTLGFRLSYMSVISIIVLVPITDFFLSIKKRVACFRDKVTVYVSKAFSVSLAVWVGTMPFTGTYFRIITPSCVAANILAVPALFFMVILSAITAFLPEYSLFCFVRVLSAAAMTTLTGVLMRSLRSLASLPGAYIRIASTGWIFSAVYYFLILSVLMVFRKRKRKIHFILILLIAANVFIWRECAIRRSENTEITFFHAGKADSSILEFPDGKVLLIDAGTGGFGAGICKGRGLLLNYMLDRGIRKIDCMIFSHPHEDHVGGALFLLENFKIGTVIDTGIFCPKNSPGFYRKIIEKIERNAIILKRTERGDKIKGFDHADIKVLSPPAKGYFGDPNNDSIVLLVSLSGGKILFTGDIEEAAIKELLRYEDFLRAEIMKAPHHGSGLGDDIVVEKFMKASSPERIIITNKKRATIANPLEAIKKNYPCRVFLTGETGAVKIRDIREGFEIETFVEK